MNLGAREPEKIEAQMAPMIDVVFQLLIFFMLTLKITKEEGDFGINMPIGAGGAPTDELPPQELLIRMTANPDGTLNNVSLGANSFGNGPGVWDSLNAEIARLAYDPAGPNDEVEVKIDADYNLHYDNTIQAVSAATGKIVNGQPVRFVETIKFAPPRRTE